MAARDDQQTKQHLTEPLLNMTMLLLDPALVAVPLQQD
jgi:hypothetical protein